MCKLIRKEDCVGFEEKQNVSEVVFNHSISNYSGLSENDFIRYSCHYKININTVETGHMHLIRPVGEFLR